MGNCLKKIDVGRHLYERLIRSRCLTDLLSDGVDEDGETIIAIHRNRTDTFDSYDDCSNDIVIDPFLVFRQRDEFTEECMAGSDCRPCIVYFDVEIASCDLDLTLAIKDAFCEAVASKQFGLMNWYGLAVQDAIVTGASEDHELITVAADFGLPTVNLDLQVHPFWS